MSAVLLVRAEEAPSGDSCKRVLSFSFISVFGQHMPSLSCLFACYCTLRLYTVLRVLYIDAQPFQRLGRISESVTAIASTT